MRYDWTISSDSCRHECSDCKPTMRVCKWLITALTALLCASLASPNLMPGDYHSQMEGTTCNIQKPTQNCDQREMRYVLRLRGLSKEKRYEMYKSMFALTHVDNHEHVREDHTYDWLLRRINIAEQFVVNVDGGEKLTHDDVASKEEL